MSKPTRTKLEPTMTSLRELSKAFPDSSRRAALLLDAADAIGGLESENTRLREFAERAWKTAEQLCQAFDGPCRADDVTAYKPCPMGERDEECVYGQLQMELRDLGIEVEE